jgi:hypothetical protein
MRICWSATRLTLLALALAGCGDDAAPPEPKPEPAPFELEGAWLYLGPSDGPHDLTFTGKSVLYADVDGKWSSTWTLKTYDNALHHFQMAFVSGSGAYLPVGQTMSGAYEVTGTFLTNQLASGTSYPPLQGPGTCTAAADGMPVPGCGLYVKK